MITITGITKNSISGVFDEHLNGVPVKIDLFAGTKCVALDLAIKNTSGDGNFVVVIADADFWSGPSLIVRYSGTNELVKTGPDVAGFINEVNESGGGRHLLDNPMFFPLVTNIAARPVVPQKLIDYVAGGGDQASFYTVGAAIAVDLIRFGIVQSPTSKIFELGSGCGRIPLALCSALCQEDGGSYTGFDIYEDGVTWAQEFISPKYQVAKFIQLGKTNAYDAAVSFKLDLPDASQDGFFATSVFTHLRYPAASAYVSEIARILKPGGKGYITFFATKEILRKFFEERGTEEDTYGFHFINTNAEDTYTDEAQVIKMLEKYGLEVLGIKYGNWRSPDNASRGLAGFQDVFIVKRKD